MAGSQPLISSPSKELGFLVPDYPFMYVVQEPGITHPHPCPLSIFCIRYGAHRKSSLPVPCVLISLTASTAPSYSRKRVLKLSKFLLLKKHIIYNNLLGCMQLMRFTRKLMILEDISGGSDQSRSRIHERTISVRFLGNFLRILRLEVSVYNFYITNQFQTTFAQGGVGRGLNKIR
jgi:hypothetical protein